MKARFLFTLFLCSFGLKATTVVNFDDLAGQDALTGIYGGIDWGTAPGWQYWGWAQPPYTAHSGSVRIGATNVESYFTFVVPGQVFDGLMGGWYKPGSTAFQSLL